MKGFRRIAAVLMGIVMIFGILQMPVKAEAADKQVFHFAYDTTHSNWAYQVNGGVWNTNLSAVKNYFNDGDVISVTGDAGAPTINIDLGKRASEIAVSNAFAIITADADYAYAIQNATLVINGNVKKGECYYTATFQINGNCEEFNAYYKDEADVYPVFAVTGTVTKANVKYTESTAVPKTIYSIPAGKFVSSSIGGVWIEKTDYSTTPPTTGNNTSGSKNNKGELDSVPKTGYGLAGSVVFFMLAAGFTVVGVLFKKKEAIR